METKNKEDQEPVHTEQVQDIIGTPPMWLYRWGISLVLAITLLCTLVSSFIQYPEVVNTRLKIISAKRLQTVSLKDSARLLAILVQNDQKVKKRQILAIAESIAGKITITAPNDGELTYAGIIRENEPLKPSQVIFIVAPYHQDFYGEMPIPSFGAAKVKPGQTVLVKLKNYPGEGQNMLKGKIKYIADNLLKGDEFIAEVDFSSDGKKNNLAGTMLRDGMAADAQIITVPSTVFHRIVQSLMKGMK